MKKGHSYPATGVLVFFVVLSSIFFLKVGFVDSLSDLKRVSDTISTSHAGAGADHRIRFTVSSAIPGSSKIVITPVYNPGRPFHIPSEMGHHDVALFVNDDEKQLGGVPDGGMSGVEIVSGDQGRITITLAGDLSLTNGDVVVIQIGTGGARITNPPVNGPYRIMIDVTESDGNRLAIGEAAIFILNPVNVGSGITVPEPIVRTLSASVISSNAVVLHGQLLNMGPVNRVEVFFDYRKKGDDDWSRTGKFGRGSIVAFSEFVAGLEPGIDYEFRAGVEWEDEEENEIREKFGQVMEFTLMDVDPGGGEGQGEGQGEGTGVIDRSGGPGGPDDGIREGEPADPPPPQIQDPPPYLGLYGWAYPQGEVILLREGVEIRRVSTDFSGIFSIEINESSLGSFSFLLKAGTGGDEGPSSTDISFTLEMDPSRGLIIRKILFSPTVEMEKGLFLTEEPIIIFGRSVPENDVNVQILKDDRVVVNDVVNVGADGRWSLSLAPGELQRGRYTARARSFAFDEESAFGGFSMFSIGQTGCDVADLNGNGRVGLADFSILMHYWGAGSSPADLNGDNIVDMIDFSIMMNCWTG